MASSPSSPTSRPPAWCSPVSSPPSRRPEPHSSHFTYEFEVSLPLFARGPLAGGATTYSWLMGAFGLGAILGGIYCTRRAQTGVPRMIRAAAGYMAAMLATAFATSVATAAVLLVVVGFASIIFLTTGNSTIQIAAAPAYRGRVTALWSTAFVGSTPIGATIIGAVGAASPRVALLVGAAACGAAALAGTAVLAHSRDPYPRGGRQPRNLREFSRR